jgi:putative redox protein
MSDFVSTHWLGDEQFDCHISGHIVRTDTSNDPEKKTGPTPKPLMLTSLAGCTGIDVVTLLKKMRVPITGLRMDVKGELTDTVPKLYSHIQLDYYFEGEDLKTEKILKAVKMSKEQYCGVSAMLEMVCPIEMGVFVNGEKVE